MTSAIPSALSSGTTGAPWICGCKPWPARIRQLYEGEWAARLGFPPEPTDVGFGYGAAELNNWRCPDKALLLEYANAARNNLLEFLDGLDEDALLTRELTTRRGETINLARMFSMLLWEVNQHGGQAGLFAGYAAGVGAVGFAIHESTLMDKNSR